MSRVYNFSAGPAVLPEEVLKQAAAEMLDYDGCGMSINEMSHRSKRQIANLRCLGIRKLNQTVEIEDTPVARGQIQKVAHLVKVEEVGKTKKK